MVNLDKNKLKSKKIKKKIKKKKNGFDKDVWKIKIYFFCLFLLIILIVCKMKTLLGKYIFRLGLHVIFVYQSFSHLKVHFYKVLFIEDHVFPPLIKSRFSLHSRSFQPISTEFEKEITQTFSCIQLNK